MLSNEVVNRPDAALSSFKTEDCGPDSEAGKGAGTVMCRAHGRVRESGQIGLNRADIGPYRAV